jgi:hypothetical protein
VRLFAVVVFVVVVIVVVIVVIVVIEETVSDSFWTSQDLTGHYICRRVYEACEAAVVVVVCEAGLSDNNESTRPVKQVLLFLLLLLVLLLVFVLLFVLFRG